MGFRYSLWIIFIGFGVIASGCHDTGEGRYEPLSIVSAEGRDGVAYLNGSIKTNTPERVQEFLINHPEIHTLIFVDMPGSDDDEANIKLAYWIYEKGYNTALLDNSIIESGAVDLFLAGRKRIGACEAEVGVHSWWDTAGYGPRDIPEDHVDHEIFLEYYEKIGIDAEFYWFTVKAAPPEGMLYMSADQQIDYGVLTEPLNCKKET